MKSCCFTGHRQLNEETVAPLLPPMLDALCQKGCTHFIAGGAVGFDMLCAEAVLALRDRRRDVTLTLVLPCPHQDKYYSVKNKARYRRLLEKADEVKMLSPFYYKGCMQARNRHMVDLTDGVLAYLIKLKGGTAYTVGYAHAQGKTVCNIAEGDAQDAKV